MHVSKCSYRPVECQWCKKLIRDEAVSQIANELQQFLHNYVSYLHHNALIMLHAGTPQE